MLKIVHPVCCGIDVHKEFVIATVATTDEKNVTTYSKSERFSTYRNGIIKLQNWLVEKNCNIVCMESTGKYWIPIYNILEDTCKITLANPRHIKNFPGNKTDKRDSIWISDLHKHNLVRGSFIPPKEIRELRDLLRYRSKLVNFRSSEKNRIQNSLTVSNFMISSVVSDTFGKSASSIIKYAMDNPDKLLDVDFKEFLHRSMIAKAEEINLSMQGSISKEQASKMKVCFDHYDYIEKCISQLDISISLLSSSLNPQIEMVTTTPGIKLHSARVITF